MIREIELILSPEQFFDRKLVLTALSKKIRIPENDIKDFRLVRKSIDARKGIKFDVKFEIITNESEFPSLVSQFEFKEVSQAKEVIIVGAGPSGYFAAIECLIQGLKPIIFERGKSIEDRKFDIAKINRSQIINPESNYAFGEGGAGTYSDGKLYTRSKKRGNITEILQLLHFFGANEEILIDSHPHIGTDKLPNIMRNIRSKIIECGGEVYFETKVSELLINNGAIKGIKISDGTICKADNVILATGHSARDVFYFLRAHNVMLEAKGFAMGVRVEHPQEIIDRIQYKVDNRADYLPAATYSLIQQIDNRGVYSFCMCPGGTIVNASTDKEHLVVNGMSNSRRNSPFANSGIVVELRPEDYSSFSNDILFSGLEFQKYYERMAAQNSASGLSAPAQRLDDFVSGKLSGSLPETSYFPRLISSPLHFWLPDIIGNRLRQGFRVFNSKMRGYITREAVVVGVESRTSSPIKIVRNPETLCSVNISGLYPCGEGAGYAGGIVSSAIDGQLAAKQIANKYKKEGVEIIK